jgi:hypothetical protein
MLGAFREVEPYLEVFHLIYFKSEYMVSNSFTHSILSGTIIGDNGSISSNRLARELMLKVFFFSLSF